MILKYWSLCVIWVSFNSFFVFQEGEISYFQPATIEIDSPVFEPQIESFDDAATGQSLVRASDQKGFPLYYYTELKTGVCFDNKCRPLDILLYWNITGRYLGFSLPEGEFLSKYEHKPFSEDEYVRLNDLLANPDLPLRNIAYENLIRRQPSDDEKVDGVSGATAPEVSTFVIEGAAYTTYKLYQVIYGPLQEKLVKRTEGRMDSLLMDQILSSTVLADKLWGLHRLQLIKKLNSQLVEELKEFLSDDYFLAYSTLDAINTDHLESKELQWALFESISGANPAIKNRILEKLAEAENLDHLLIEQSVDLLKKAQGQTLLALLDLYKAQGVKNELVCSAVGNLAKSDNRFIQAKATEFMKFSDCPL